MRRKTIALGVTGLLAFFWVGLSSADDNIVSRDPKTRIETFLDQKERLLIKDIHTLGKITGLYSSSGLISAIVAYQPGEKENRLKGLIVEVYEGQNEEKSHSSYIDMDEIENLSAALSSMASMVEERNKKENPYTEFVYSTRDELSFGIYMDEKDEGGFISAGGSENLTVSLEIHQMNEIRKTLDYGHTLLKMK